MERNDFAWRLSPVTPDDLDVIKHEAENAPPDSAIMAIGTNAMYERNEVDGSVSERWRFDARLVMRNTELEYKAINISTTAPFIEMPLSEANEWWRGEVIEFVVGRLLPAILKEQSDA